MHSTVLRQSTGTNPTGTKRESRKFRKLAMALLIGFVIAGPAHAESDFAQRSGQAFDLIVVRPLGVGRILMGVVAFIPAVIFAQVPSSDRLQSSVAETWRFFVYDQVEATFMTPLGEFEEEY